MSSCNLFYFSCSSFIMVFFFLPSPWFLCFVKESVMFVSGWQFISITNNYENNPYAYRSSTLDPISWYVIVPIDFQSYLAEFLSISASFYFSCKCLLEFILAFLFNLSFSEIFLSLIGCLLDVGLQLFRAGFIALLAFPGWQTWRLCPAFGYDDKRVSRSIGICLLSSVYGPLFPEVALMWYRYTFVFFTYTKNANWPMTYCQLVAFLLNYANIITMCHG